MNADAQAVLDFWFGAEGSREQGTLRREWFRKDAAFDALIARRFGALVESALSGRLVDWQERPASALARVVLLDQFTRNIFRDTPRAFAGDELALAAARAMVSARQDDALTWVQRGFVYLPYEHAEDLAAQEEAVGLLTRLAAAAPQTKSMLAYAHRHRAVIARFGRFPHRNAVLGRPSTAEEEAFLREPGSRF